MIKNSSKCWFVPKLILMVFLVAFNAGCFKSACFTPDMEDRLITLEKNIDLLSYNIEKLFDTGKKYENELNILDVENKQLNKEYALLTDSQLEIEFLQKSQEIERETFNNKLLEARNLILGFEDMLSVLVLEEEQLRKGHEELITLYESEKEEKSIFDPKYVVKKTEKVVETSSSPINVIEETKEAEKEAEKEGSIDIEELQEEQKSFHVKNMFNSAETLYMRGEYEEAIAKWEEVLNLEPTMLDAVYNMEFAKDRIKQRQDSFGE